MPNKNEQNFPPSLYQDWEPKKKKNKKQSKEIKSKGLIQWAFKD